MSESVMICGLCGNPLKPYSPEGGWLECCVGRNPDGHKFWAYWSNSEPEMKFRSQVRHKDLWLYTSKYFTGRTTRPGDY